MFPYTNSTISQIFSHNATAMQWLKLASDGEVSQVHAYRAIAWANAETIEKWASQYGLVSLLVWPRDMPFCERHALRIALRSCLEYGRAMAGAIRAAELEPQPGTYGGIYAGRPACELDIERAIR